MNDWNKWQILGTIVATRRIVDNQKHILVASQQHEPGSGHVKLSWNQKKSEN